MGEGAFEFALVEEFEDLRQVVVVLIAEDRVVGLADADEVFDDFAGLPAVEHTAFQNGEVAVLDDLVVVLHTHMLQHEVEGEEGLEAVVLAAFADKGADTLSLVNGAFVFQLRQSCPDGGTTDVQGLHELVLGGELGMCGILPGDDELHDVLFYEDVKSWRIFAFRHR